eukprot:COSAG04_NODE_496_length_13410_cov_8.377733_9_plen_208_part_00
MTSRSSARVSAPPLATLAAAAADPVANTAHAGAGGNSVFNHLAQPASFPFYSKAIIESGLNDEGARTNDDAEDGFVALLKTSGCPGRSSTNCVVIHLESCYDSPLCHVATRARLPAVQERVGAARSRQQDPSQQCECKQRSAWAVWLLLPTLTSGPLLRTAGQGARRARRLLLRPDHRRRVSDSLARRAHRAEAVPQQGQGADRFKP